MFFTLIDLGPELKSSKTCMRVFLSFLPLLFVIHSALNAGVMFAENFTSYIPVKLQPILIRSIIYTNN